MEAKDLVQQLWAPSTDLQRRVFSRAVETFKKTVKVAKAIQSETSGPVAFFKAGLVKVDDCKSVIWRTDEIFGTIDVAANLESKTDSGNIINTSPELFDEIMTVNIRA